ncbi:Uncharacterised protein g6682 [Pycnogonum litorale]
MNTTRFWDLGETYPVDDCHDALGKSEIKDLKTSTEEKAPSQTVAERSDGKFEDAAKDLGKPYPVDDCRDALGNLEIKNSKTSTEEKAASPTLAERSDGKVEDVGKDLGETYPVDDALGNSEIKDLKTSTEEKDDIIFSVSAWWAVFCNKFMRLSLLFERNER